mmetsp:Transcript_11291/g.9979  ORF Transcript_11291/g.9979 Transcript_11291/m.9979 type:complete len:121 (-) Transcript_11291:23-385(-)
MNKKDLKKEIVDKMLLKYGKNQTKLEEDFPIGYESKIEMTTDTLNELTNGQIQNTRLKEVYDKVNQIYERIQENSNKVTELARKTRVITWKQKISQDNKEVEKLKLQANKILNSQATYLL